MHAPFTANRRPGQEPLLPFSLESLRIVSAACKKIAHAAYRRERRRLRKGYGYDLTDAFMVARGREIQAAFQPLIPYAMPEFWMGDRAAQRGTAAAEAEGVERSFADASGKLRLLVQEFLLKVADPDFDPKAQPQSTPGPGRTRDLFKRLARRFGPDPDLAWAIGVDPGGSKTTITIEELADWLHRLGTRLEGPIIYAVPRHELGEEILKKFLSHGIDARIFRGRSAKDPDEPDELMCRNQKQYQLAVKLRADIYKTCCHSKNGTCPLKATCKWIGQIPKKGEPLPQVWIVAHELLFSGLPALGDPVAVIVDEGLWKSGIRHCAKPLRVDDIGTLHPPPPLSEEEKKDQLAKYGRVFYQPYLSYLRKQLREALQINHEWIEMVGYHGIDRRIKDFVPNVLFKLDAAIKLEWQEHQRLVQSLQLRPGLSADEIERVDRSETASAIAFCRDLIEIWKCPRQLFDDPSYIEVSGRLTHLHHDGELKVRWDTVVPIVEQFHCPTLLLDATLPALEILRLHHWQVRIMDNIRIAMPPHTRIRQVLGAPTSSRKLDKPRNRQAILNYILERWRECEQKPPLVVVQKKLRKWLKQQLQQAEADNIAVMHFGNLTGIDEHKYCRLEIVVGRPLPQPRKVEALAGTLSGQQPGSVRDLALNRPDPDILTRRFWYERDEHYIRLPDDEEYEVKCERHPDEFTEMLRWLICEAELIQAIGRSRGIHRDAEHPLDIDLLFDQALPLTVNAVQQWRPPAAEQIQLHGVLLTSPSDMAKAFPASWPNRKAAYRTLRTLDIAQLTQGWQAIEYQYPGERQKRRMAYFDPHQFADAQACTDWLRLGPLKMAGPVCTRPPSTPGQTY
jgi:putative DNA primase/helicase